jgi:hypothetical protein
MCDYSLHAVASRAAEAGDRLVSTSFNCTKTRGFAAESNLDVAVCLRPGTELAFADNVRYQGVLFRRNVGDRMARFRQIDTEKFYQHHDALEFSNGMVVLVTDLVLGQRATVVQMPAAPVKKQHSQETSARPDQVPQSGEMDRPTVRAPGPSSRHTKEDTSHDQKCT